MDEQQNVPQPEWTTWWNHSSYTALVLSTTLSSTATIWCDFHANCTALVPHTGVERLSSCSAPNSQPSLSSIVSYFPLGLTRNVRTQTVSLCSLPSVHHTTAADASTQLSILEFLHLCFTKHPFRRTVPLRLHEDLREAQTPSNTGNSMQVTFAYAATQLSFAEFFERCILSSPAPLCFKMHPLRLPHTVPLSQMPPPNSRSQSSFLGASTPMTRWIDSLQSPHFPIPSTRMPLSVSAVPVVVTFALLSHARNSTEHHRRRQDSRFNLP